jgi:hypothetical protein
MEETEHEPYDPQYQVRIRKFEGPDQFWDVSASRAAEIMELDEAEVEWALEEYGRCDTTEWVCWQPSETNGWEWPTAESPKAE